MSQLMIIAICGIIVTVTTICLVYYIYTLALIDAKARGIEKPKFWSLIAASGSRGEGLILYLFKRRGMAAILSPLEKKQMDTTKRKIYCLMAIAVCTVIVVVATMLKM